MTYTLRRAITSEAKPLIGLYAESSGGKTKSALLLACGFCSGDMSKVGMIETESGRGEAWADDEVVGGYQVIPIRENFSPKEYGAAIAACEKGELRALIIDSASHEWEGVGGVLAMAAENQAAGKKGPIVWQQPKMQHAREFMLRLTQTAIPLVIVCMRAKYVMEEVTPAVIEKLRATRATGKLPNVGDWVRSKDLSPKQSEDILFEMFVHGWMDKETHSFHGTKYTVDSMRKVLIDGEPITVDTGKRLAQWASGTKPAGQNAAPLEKSPAGALPAQSGGTQDGAATITPDEALALEARCTENNIGIPKVKKFFKVERFSQLTPDQLVQAHATIDSTLAERAKEPT